MALYQIIIPGPRLAEASSVMRSQETLPRWNVDGTAPDCASLMAVDRGPDQNITIFCMYVLTMLLCRYTNSTRLVGVSGGRVGVATSMAGGGTALSVLTISSVHLADRGNYTCKPASGGHASVSLHVLEGDY